MIIVWIAVCIVLDIIVAGLTTGWKWLCGAVVRALDLELEISRGFNPSRCTVECNLGQVVYTHCPAPLLLQPYGTI